MTTMPAKRLKIFISSVQKEFAQQRSDLKAFLLGDAVLSRFVSEVFLFEELPAKDRRAEQAYLEEVERCDIYLGLFGYEYGNENQQGLSPTEHEFNHATKHKKTRLVYVWGSNEKRRDQKMRKLIARVNRELIRRRTEDTNSLTAEVYASLVNYLDGIGALRIPPFDTSTSDKATLKDLSRTRIDWFLKTARRERGFPLKATTETKALLTHLNLIDGSQPTNAAILLFGANPQRFHLTAETKCVSCHGTQYRRPFASMQIYSGDLFEQADRACEFILARINRAIGLRATSITAPTTYELPPDVIREAIVNAIAHRDYHSNASVEVRLFANRLEIWNPGAMPGTLTLDDLRKAHPSVPNNPLIAESLYLTRYIEKAGSGTLLMMALCQEAGLPEPTYELRAGSFVITLWRDWLTDEVLAQLDLNERQRQAIAVVKVQGQITNRNLREQSGVTIRTASRDLEELVRKGVLVKVGATGRSTFYVIARKPDINWSNKT